MDLAALLLALTLRSVDVQRPRLSEVVTVAGESPSIAAPSAVTVLGGEELAAMPSLALDDALRSVPGFSLFRRSSSRVANPTTQGVTLRGLAASGSSRALVLADDVPLNDPVGGWVYWNRIPIAAVQEVAVARGASGDLHGADSIAGVVSVRGRETAGLRLLVEGGSDETGRISGHAGGRAGAAHLFGSAEAFTTDGFITTAPEARGPVDTPAASRHASVIGSLQRRPVRGVRAGVRGSHFGESRGNGTPAQRNATRATQGSVGLAGGHSWSVRAYGLRQQYEQSFSAVDGERTSERLTSEQQVSATVVGTSADWSWSGGNLATLLSGTSRAVGAELEQTVFTAAGVRLPTEVIEPSQSIVAAAAQVRAAGARAAAGGGLRVELWRSSLSGTNRQTFLSPRVWTSLAATEALTIRLAYQSGYRGPTINELYRPFRVGNIVTEANAGLEPERAGGIEAGASWHAPGRTLRVLGFWSRVDDAIVNVTLSDEGPVIVRQRRNAARIRARGVEVEAEVRAGRSVVLSAATAFTDSLFVAGPLEGRDVPQIPRWHHTAGARGAVGAFRLSAEWRFTGRQFDDDRNAFALDRSWMLDVRAGWMVRRQLELFGAIENALDEEQDVGRTPFRTVGLPRTARVGMRLSLD